MKGAEMMPVNAFLILLPTLLAGVVVAEDWDWDRRASAWAWVMGCLAKASSVDTPRGRARFQSEYFSIVCLSRLF